MLDINIKLLNKISQIYARLYSLYCKEIKIKKDHYYINTKAYQFVVIYIFMIVFMLSKGIQGNPTALTKSHHNTDGSAPFAKKKNKTAI